MKNRIFKNKIFLIWISSILIFSPAFPRLVSLDVLSLNGVDCIYLYGDDHNPSFKNIESGELKVFLEKITKIEKGKTFFWIEDLFAAAQLRLTEDEILKFDVSNKFIEYGFLLCGLVQRIDYLSKQNLIPFNVEFRLVTSDVVKFFNPYALPPMVGVYPPSMVKKDTKLNKFKILVSDFFLEIENCKKNILEEIEKFDCPKPILEKIYIKMAEIEKDEKSLRTFLVGKNIKDDDILLYKAIEIMFKDLAEAGFPDDDLNKCIEILDKVKLSYTKDLEDGSWLKLHKTLSELIEDFCNNTDKKIKVNRRPIFEFALKIGGGLLEIMVLLKILQNLGKGTQVAVLGSTHTKNIKNLLLENGFVYNSELSVKEGDQLYFPKSKIVFKDI